MTHPRLAYLDEARLPELRDEACLAFDQTIREAVASARQQTKPS